jgi:asparagine synthase (glutamine-hydrolysing)
MAAALAFRGPDATHVTTQPGAGFVFTFLRTGPAPQSSQQPCTLDGRLWLIGDVRLDGRDNLRRKLEQHGASIPSTATDEELILHAYQKWGEQSFPDLIGDYAVALWDSIARRLLCLRDLIGSRPFFYAHVSGQLIFSNTLNAIRFAPKVSAELDRHFIADFLLQESCPDLARTAFQDISRLPPLICSRIPATISVFAVSRRSRSKNRSSSSARRNTSNNFARCSRPPFAIVSRTMSLQFF